MPPGFLLLIYQVNKKVLIASLLILIARFYFKFCSCLYVGKINFTLLGRFSMSNIKKIIAIAMFGLSICFTPVIYAQTSLTDQPEKVTIESLLSKTLAATEETQTYFDKQQVNNNSSGASSNIAFPPTIDISYSEAITNIDQNIGANIRWGGQVLKSVTLNESVVRLTVYAYPLANDGRPIETKQADSQGGRFIVELIDGFAHGVDFEGRLLTFYGSIASQSIVSNGKRKTEIPVIKALEFVDWNVVDQNIEYADNRSSNSYYILDSRLGYSSHYYSPYYANTRSEFSSHGSLVDLGFSNRQFSIHRSLSDRGLNNQRFNNHREFRRNNRSFSNSRGFSKKNYRRRSFRRY